MRRLGTSAALLLGICAVTARAETVDPRARLLEAESASEHWDLAARFDSGHFVMARFQISNEGPGRHNAAATGQIVFPDGSHRPFHNGRQRGDWVLGTGSLSLDIGSSDFDLRAPLRRLDVDNKKRGIKIHLRLRADAPRERQPELLPGYAVDLIDLAAPIEGTLWVAGMAQPAQVAGIATLSHTTLERNEFELLQRRWEAFGRAGEQALWLLALRDGAGRTANWLRSERAGAPLLDSRAIDLLPAGKAADWSRTEYPLAGEWTLAGASVRGRMGHRRVLHHGDPFRELPGLLRLLLSSRSRPWRIWTDSPIELSAMAGASDLPPLPIPIRMEGLATFTFLNPQTTP